MTVPVYVTLCLGLALAAWRCFVLTARDLILDKWRDRFAPVGSTRRDFLECPYCAGFWWTGIWVTGAWLLLVPWEGIDSFDALGIWFLSWWAVAAMVAFIEHVADRITDL